MAHNEVLATNLKRYTKLSKDVYKILLSYHYSGNREAKANLTEAEFAPAIQEMFNGEVGLIPNTLVDYKALNGDQYKTCLVKATAKIIPVSTASLNGIVSANNFTTIAKNVFLDATTNNIWKKVVTESGVVQLVQDVVENLEDLIKRRLDVREVTASANPICALATNKFDFTFFYNPNSYKVESGIVLVNNKDSITVASRQQQKPVSIDPHFVIAAANVPALTQQFEKELKNSKNALDVMQAYLNFWLKTDSEGSKTADYIEKEMKKDAFKLTASVEGDDVEPLEKELTESENTSLTKEEVEVAITSKFDEAHVAAFALVETNGDKNFVCKFTKKDLEVDNIIYIINKLTEIFGICPCVDATSEFVNFIINQD